MICANGEARLVKENLSNSKSEQINSDEVVVVPYDVYSVIPRVYLIRTWQVFFNMSATFAAKMAVGPF